MVRWPQWLWYQECRLVCFIFVESSIGQRCLQTHRGPIKPTSKKMSFFLEGVGVKTIKNLNFRIEFSSFDHSSKFCIQFLSQLDILSMKPVFSNCAPWNSTGISTARQAGQGRGGEGKGSEGLNPYIPHQPATLLVWSCF